MSDINPRDERFVAAIARSQVPLSAFLRTLMLRSMADVDDVLQETHMVLWRKRAEYDPERPFMPWACRIAYLQALAFQKKQGRHSCHSLSEPLLEDVSLLSAAEAEKSDEKMKLLELCLQKLSESRRRLLRSRYQHQMPLKDLAESQGRTADALSMELYRIRAVLRNCVQQRMETEVAP